MPLYFRVILDNDFFGCLSRGKDGWNELNGSQHRKGIIGAIGELISECYEQS
jgi:hypothetical protein